jgi:hypothetical protein
LCLSPYWAGIAPAKYLPLLGKKLLQELQYDMLLIQMTINRLRLKLRKFTTDKKNGKNCENYYQEVAFRCRKKELAAVSVL